MRTEVISDEFAGRVFELKSMVNILDRLLALIVAVSEEETSRSEIVGEVAELAERVRLEISSRTDFVLTPAHVQLL